MTNFAHEIAICAKFEEIPWVILKLSIGNGADGPLCIISMPQYVAGYTMAVCMQINSSWEVLVA